MEDSVLAPLEDSKVKESAFMAETADTEAPEPHIHNRGRTSPIVQRFSQIDAVNDGDTYT